jgi:hypothetical protein
VARIKGFNILVDILAQNSSEWKLIARHKVEMEALVLLLLDLRV